MKKVFFHGDLGKKSSRFHTAVTLRLYTVGVNGRDGFAWKLNTLFQKNCLQEKEIVVYCNRKNKITVYPEIYKEREGNEYGNKDSGC